MAEGGAPTATAREAVASPGTRRVRRLAIRWLVFQLVFVAGSVFFVMFFHQGLSANPLSRLLTVFGLVEDSHLYADRWGDQTIDKALIHGHVYSDKAPLASFLVLPFYALWRVGHRSAPLPLYEEAAVLIADFVASAVPFAIFALLLFRRALTSLDAAPAARVSLLVAFSTCLFNYGNTFFGHMLAALLLVAAYALAVERGRPLWAGLIGGFSVLTEYPMVLFQAILAVWLLGRRGRGWRACLSFCAGALVPAAALLAYNTWVTGRPWSFPYSHVSEVWAPMRTAFGLRSPSPEAAWELLFGQYRGLLFYAPTLAVLAPLALRCPARADGVGRAVWGLLVALCATDFLFVASYFKWDGGWCTGPRHLSPIIALLLYAGIGPLAAAWVRYRVVFLGAAAMGIFVNLVAAASSPILPESFAHPLFDSFLPAIEVGRVNDHNFGVESGLVNGSWLVGLWVVLFVLFVAGLTLMANAPPELSSPARHETAS